MPIYTYRCLKCDQRFDRTEQISEHGSVKPKCPKCGDEEVQNVMVPIIAKTSRKS